MLSPSSTGSPTTPSGMLDMMRPNSSMAQPHHGGYGNGSNGPMSHQPNGLPAQMMPPQSQTVQQHLQQQQQQQPPSYGGGTMMPSSSTSYMMGPRGLPNGGGMRGHVPAPLNVPPMARNLNGPLSHSSPRVIGAAGNVGGDYYWGS